MPRWKFTRMSAALFKKLGVKYLHKGKPSALTYMSRRVLPAPADISDFRPRETLAIVSQRLKSELIKAAQVARFCCQKQHTHDPSWEDLIPLWPGRAELAALRHRFSLKSKAKQTEILCFLSQAKAKKKISDVSQRGCCHLIASVRNCTSSLRTCPACLGAARSYAVLQPWRLAGSGLRLVQKAAQICSSTLDRFQQVKGMMCAKQ